MLTVKRLNVCSTHNQYADRMTLAKKRQTEVGAKSAQSLDLPQAIVRVGQDVGDLNRLVLQQNASDDALPSRCKCEVSDILVVFRCMSIAGC